MTGSTPEHSSIAGHIGLLFQIQLARSGPCRTHRDQYVAIPDQKAPVCPDVVLTCDLGDWNKDRRLKPFRMQSPLIVGEVEIPTWSGSNLYHYSGRVEHLGKVFGN